MRKVDSCPPGNVRLATALVNRQGVPHLVQLNHFDKLGLQNCDLCTYRPKYKYLDQTNFGIEEIVFIPKTNL